MSTGDCSQAIHRLRRTSYCPTSHPSPQQSARSLLSYSTVCSKSCRHWLPCTTSPLRLSWDKVASVPKPCSVPLSRSSKKTQDKTRLPPPPSLQPSVESQHPNQIWRTCWISTSTALLPLHYRRSHLKDSQVSKVLQVHRRGSPLLRWAAPLNHSPTWTTFWACSEMAEVVGHLLHLHR